jgi:hypothetical protein
VVDMGMFIDSMEETGNIICPAIWGIWRPECIRLTGTAAIVNVQQLLSEWNNKCFSLLEHYNFSVFFLISDDYRMCPLVEREKTTMHCNNHCPKFVFTPGPP